jgi:predicted Fe-Mo cluster-binding NifX family protein
MKICIPSIGLDLESQVDSNFGRCEYFIFIDLDDLSKYEAIQNASACASGGAGITAAQFVVDKGTEVVLAEKIGPKALAVLESANIKIITGATGKIKEVIEKYKKGELK